jgi:hypothetical protein
MLMVEFDVDLQKSNDRFKISIKDMFPCLWGLKDDKLRKLSVLFLDVEKNPFFLMEKDVMFVTLANRLGISLESIKNHYDSLKPSGLYYSVAKEYISYQNLVEYRLYATCVYHALTLAEIIRETPKEDLNDSQSKAFERSINWSKEFVDFYANYDKAMERIERILQSDIHKDVLKDIIGVNTSPQKRADSLLKTLGQIP